MSTQPLALVYRALNLGDFLTGVPAYRAIARAFPTHCRLLAAPAVFAPLARLTQAFNGIIDTPAEALQPLPSLGDIDIAVDLHGCGPKSYHIIEATNPAHIIAFRHEAIPCSSERPHWRADEHEVMRWCRLLTAHGIAADPADLYLPRPPSMAAWRDIVILHPGAAAPSRRWPLDRWARIATVLTRRGERVVITGTRTEMAAAQIITKAAGIAPSQMLAGRTSLATMTMLTAHARLVVSGDTGIAHLAYAFARPSVTLFGPMSPTLWGPPPMPQHRTLWYGISGDPHGTTLDKGLAQITVDDVLDEISALFHDINDALRDSWQRAPDHLPV